MPTRPTPQWLDPDGTKLDDDRWRAPSPLGAGYGPPLDEGTATDDPTWTPDGTITSSYTEGD